ncbi:MAG: hypothetical protein ACYCO5_02925 [Acidobacteriaceae bacterium]
MKIVRRAAPVARIAAARRTTYAPGSVRGVSRKPDCASCKAGCAA